MTRVRIECPPAAINLPHPPGRGRCGEGHHVIEQQAFRDSLLLRKLSDHGLFDLDGPHNMLNLPADRALADQLGVSPVQQQTRDSTGQVAKGPRLV